MIENVKNTNGKRDLDVPKRTKTVSVSVYKRYFDAPFFRASFPVLLLSFVRL